MLLRLPRRLRLSLLRVVQPVEAQFVVLVLRAVPFAPQPHAYQLPQRHHLRAAAQQDALSAAL